MTAAAYRGIAPRECADSSFRITLRTLGTRRRQGNAQNVLIAASAGDANGGTWRVVSPIGVSGATTSGLASSGDRAAGAHDLRCARFPGGRRAFRASDPPPERDTDAARVVEEHHAAAALGRR